MNSEAKSLGQQLYTYRAEGRTSLRQVYHIKLSVVLHTVGLIYQKKVGGDKFGNKAAYSVQKFTLSVPREENTNWIKKQDSISIFN